MNISRFITKNFTKLINSSSYNCLIQGNKPSVSSSCIFCLLWVNAQISTYVLKVFSLCHLKAQLIKVRIVGGDVHLMKIFPASSWTFLFPLDLKQYSFELPSLS